MNLFLSLAAGIRALFHRNRIEREMDDELHAYLDASANDKIGAVGTTLQASRLAKVEMGSLESVKFEVRSLGWEFFMQTFLQDLRFALRTLAKKPAFTSIAVLTLALGIGANTAVFTVVNAVLLKTLPYRNEKRLVMVWEHNLGRSSGTVKDHNVVAPANFLFWLDNNTVFDQMAAMYDGSAALTGEGEPEQIPYQAVTPNLFYLLGVSPVLGRDFSADEGLPDRNHVLLLSYGLWQRKFGGDPKITGAHIKLDGAEYTVIGVMPPRTQLFSPEGSLTGDVAQMWRPIAWGPNARQPRGRFLTAVARLKERVNIAQAQGQMDSLVAQFRRQYPDFETGWGVNLVPLHRDLTANVRVPLLVITAAVAFVLLIACANVANLLLSRAVEREREIAVRTVLGANRKRIISQALTESLVLAALGAVSGILLALWGTSILLRLAPKQLLTVGHVALDWRVLFFTIIVACVTGILFGLLPALESSRVHPHDSLREGGRSITARRGRALRNVFAVVQIAFSLILLAGSGLVLRSFRRLISVDPGFNAQSTLTARVDLPFTKYKTDEQAITFFQQLLDRVRSLPGVQNATMSNSMPLTGMTPGTDFTIIGQPPPPAGQNYITQVQLIDPDYFRALGIPLLKGRGFTNREELVPSHVVIINQALAREYFPHEDPLGKKVMIEMGEKDPSTIIGVVGDVRRISLDAAPVALSYWPHSELAFSTMMLAIRTTGDPDKFAPTLQSVVRQMDPDIPLSSVSTMEEWIGDSVARQRFSTVLLAVFAAIALLLAAIGIYGVVSYATNQRTREFGVRMALGAESGDVLWLVVRHGVRLAALGVLIGLAGAAGLVQFLRSLLYNTSPYDPATLIGVAAFLAGVTLIACWIPARRATRVDPIVALRYE